MTIDSQDAAMAWQQSGCPWREPAKMQAETGSAVQKTTTAIISNAPFLFQFIVCKTHY